MKQAPGRTRRPLSIASRNVPWVFQQSSGSSPLVLAQELLL